MASWDLHDDGEPAGTDWQAVAVWAGLTVFCMACWAGVVYGLRVLFS